MFPSKATFFHPPSPIYTTLNLLSSKNTAVLLISAQILCCKARTSHRFKSLPAIPSKVAAFRKTGYLMNAGHFHKNTVSTGDLNRPRSPEVRKPLVYFWYFSYTRKVRKTFPSQEVSSFFKPRISAPQPQLRTATIKTFLRELRGFSNLEAAHKNNNFAQTNLNPSAAPSGYSFCFAENLALLFEAKSRAKPCQWSKSYNNWKKCRIDFSVEKIYNNKGIIPQFFQHFHKTASQFAISIHGSKEENS